MTSLPLYPDANYKLTRESPEFQREFVEERDGKQVGGWELRLPGRGPDGVPYQFIFVGPTSEHRGSAIRVSMLTQGGSPAPDDATVKVESFYKTGSEQVTMLETPYQRFAAIDQNDPDSTLTAQARAEAGEDYIVRVEVALPPGAPAPDPWNDASYFELECVKLWWNETA